MPTPRSLLLDCLYAALRRVDGRRCVREELEARPIDSREVIVVAMGKAASAMTLGALDALGDRVVEGLIVTKDGHLDGRLACDRRFRCIESGHPVPDARSLDAGEVLLDLVDNASRHVTLLFLVSGGASSLVEAPVRGVELEDLRRLGDALLASGLPIEAMNAVRGRVSRIKGGRLGARLHGRSARALLISDVPGDDPRVIASGPLTAPRAAALPESLPAAVEAVLHRAEPVSDPEPDDLAAVEVRIVARSADAQRAAADTARRHGYDTWAPDERLTGDSAEQGERLARALLDGSAGVTVHGGETTVRLPAQPGRGGRNQHLALAAARVLNGHDGVALLAAGTDGTDGPTDDAGALVDGGTLERGADAGLDDGAALARADAGTFLEAAGDLIQTGPTGTNVMDLVITIRDDTDSAQRRRDAEKSG